MEVVIDMSHKNKRKGKFFVDRGLCPFCSHHKCFNNLVMGSPNFNGRKCCRCKRWF